MALGPAVEAALMQALTVLGDWAGTGATPAAEATTDDGKKKKHGESETTLSSGDVVEIGGNGHVQSIPLNQAPKSLQNALSNGVLNGLSPGSGH
jgi:hypothetical protein